MLAILQKILLPYFCVCCRQRSDQESDLCRACMIALPYSLSACQQCARPMPPSQTTVRICGACLSKPPHFDHTYACFDYRSPIKKWISQLKFQQQLCYARILSDLMHQSALHWPTADVLIPVPLHAKRLRKRGFNQALELAKPISKQLAMPIDNSSCRRIRDTAAQSSLSANRRQHNVKNAFITTSAIEGHVIIIDDVITTGHTVNELSRVIRQAGAKRIDIWCCARAI